ncbi:MAG: hypothetical protein HQL21_00370 [Candidatus Omnitrophica bacterium]|nr:hypothetical protein [Candidatus Omnitrophota bacterium]
MMTKMKTIIFSVFAAAIFLVVSSTVHADMKQMKIYKEAFPEAKAKCVECHTDAMPKKDDGKHDVNDYGAAVMEQAKKDAEAAAVAEVVPTAETYKKVGKIEEFKK